MCKGKLYWIKNYCMFNKGSSHFLRNVHPYYVYKDSKTGKMFAIQFSHYIDPKKLHAVRQGKLKLMDFGIDKTSSTVLPEHYESDGKGRPIDLGLLKAKEIDDLSVSDNQHKELIKWTSKKVHG